MSIFSSSCSFLLYPFPLLFCPIFTAVVRLPAGPYLLLVAFAPAPQLIPGPPQRRRCRRGLPTASSAGSMVFDAARDRWRERASHGRAATTRHSACRWSASSVLAGHGTIDTGGARTLPPSMFDLLLVTAGVCAPGDQTPSTKAAEHGGKLACPPPPWTLLEDTSTLPLGFFFFAGKEQWRGM